MDDIAVSMDGPSSQKIFNMVVGADTISGVRDSMVHSQAFEVVDC